MFDKFKKLFSNSKKEFYIEKQNNVNYEDELLKQFGKNEIYDFAHINLLIITDTHNCLYYDKESIEKIKNTE